MNVGLSDRIRSLAQERYVKPAMREGRSSFSIRVRDLLNDLQAEGFPGGHTPQVCNALQTAKFLRENGLQIEEVQGPQSKMSPTVLFDTALQKLSRRNDKRSHRRLPNPLMNPRKPERFVSAESYAVC